MRESKTLRGVSYGSAIQRPENLAEILGQRFAFIEVPLSGQTEFVRIWDFAKRHHFKLSLHIPSWELVRELPCILNIQTVDDVTRYLMSIRRFLHEFSEFEYIVMHFPLTSSSKDIKLLKQINECFFDGITNIIHTYNLRLFVENVTVSSFFYSASDYGKLCHRVDGICLDIGHAHTLTYVLQQAFAESPLQEMAEQLAENIICVHLYNTVSEPVGSYSPKTHYPFIPSFAREKGFIVPQLVESYIGNMPNLEYIVFEPHRTEYKKYHSFGSLDMEI